MRRSNRRVLHLIRQPAWFEKVKPLTFSWKPVTDQRSRAAGSFREVGHKTLAQVEGKTKTLFQIPPAFLRIHYRLHSFFSNALWPPGWFCPLLF